MSIISPEPAVVTPQKQISLKSLEANHGSFLTIARLSALKTLRLNDLIYGRVHPDDPETIALADSIKRHGLLEPIVITSDNVVVSGHRRKVACQLAGLKTVQVRKLANLKSSDPAFTGLLTAFNEQRVKSREHQVREGFASLDPAVYCQRLVERRKQNQAAIPKGIDIGSRRRRARISKARAGFLNAALKIINNLKDHWPLTDRQIHYQLLNDPPLIHGSKPDSRYCNDQKSYKQLCKLMTQARVEGRIPFDVIHDPTRPTTSWQVDPNVGLFLKREVNGFLKNYHRDMMQSQPAHIEVIGEKMTIESIVKPVCMEFGIPLSIGRGYSSITLCHDVKQRFRESNKDKLIVLMLSDFDPEGEDLPAAFGLTLRDDLNISEDQCAIHKVTLTAQQVKDYKLPRAMEAKKTSTRHKKFSKKNGNFAYELEALPPAELKKLLRAAILSNLNLLLFNAEVAKEEADRARLNTVLQKVKDVLPGLVV
ncbi:MAG: ParB N-terminal domain-containing protein [Gemmatales bacterium]